jgi:nucleotide-binding universal stress UspA family protein
MQRMSAQSEDFAMSVTTLMCHVELDSSSDARVDLAADLANRLNTTLIGISAWMPRPPLTYGGMIVDQKLLQSDLEEITKRLDECGRRFQARVGTKCRVEWRSAIADPTDYLARECRAADLVIIGRDRHGDIYQSIDPGSLILKAGRPVLTVPPEVHALSAERIIVAWKETREARRAVRDSLPFLRKAKEVSVLSMLDFVTGASSVREFEQAAEQRAREHLEDVVAYLGRHDISVKSRAVLRVKGSVADELIRNAERAGADLIAAGAYGRTRLGEWLFGGVTHELLAKAPLCCLFSS